MPKIQYFCGEHPIQETMEKVSEKLKNLRLAMLKEDLAACIIPSADAHQSEYTADYAKFRTWISGFTGSAGTLVVTQNSAGLWTDSRYFLQADVELKDSGIGLFKANMPGTPLPEEWIASQHCRSVGVDGAVFNTKEGINLREFFLKSGIRFQTDFKPYNKVWPNRPSRPKGPVRVFPEHLSGESTQSKLAKLRNELHSKDADFLLMAMLDEIAWSFNLRGSDIAFNPVTLSYACIGREHAWLFVDTNKIDAETAKHLSAEGIEHLPYDAFPEWISSLNNKTILLDAQKINFEIFHKIHPNCRILDQPSPAYLLKGIKNPIELDGFKKAMIKDGVALTRFLMWLEDTIQTKNQTLDEFQVGSKIAEFRAEQEAYVSESFAPIVGLNENGAIIHYEASKESASFIGSKGYLLIDTGGQYTHGTTDITRTFCLEQNASQAFKEDYTALLKGLITLSSIHFPKGTRGTQLDVLARQFIWNRNINYYHGTGHGVGHFLNVHEGPHSIRMNENPTPLQPGMVVTNEPGIYRTGKWGIRLENMLFVKELEISEFGNFLAFETLTLFPFDKKCVHVEALTSTEVEWLNHYHEQTYQKLASHLSESERSWLRKKTDLI